MLQVAFFLVTCISALTAETVTVSTPLGKLNGQVIGQTSVFLGVPYALPPTGDRRFRRPQPPAPWEGTFDATKYANACHQEHLPPYMYQDLVGESEDCLILDIFIDGKVIDEKKKMPVMVYIHGGAFLFGFSKTYNLEHFVSGRGIIAVVIQYRLGLFGFAQSPDDKSIPGNNGLVDQVAAIKWVKNYISYFGGDPNSITISGQSAGSNSITYHLLSPLSAGLFNRVILQSGTHATMELLTKEQVNCSMQAIIEQTECRGSADEYECLRSVPVDKLTQPVEPMICGNYKASNSFLPTLDSEFFQGIPPTERVKQQKFINKPDSLIMGHVGNEGAVFFLMFLPTLYPPQSSPVDASVSKEEFTREALENCPDEMKGTIVKTIEAAFGDKTSMGRIEVLNKMGKITGDTFFGCPSRQFMESMFKCNPQMKAYYYYFTYRPKSASKLFMPYINESCHGDEVPITYGLWPYLPGAYTKQEEEMSEKIVDNFVNFVKTGTVSDKQWPQSTSTDSGVQFNHIEFADPLRFEYRAGFPPTHCASIGKMNPFSK